MSADAAVYVVYPISEIGCCQKCGKYAPCTRRTAQGEFELTLTVKMETRHPVEGYFGNEFWAICNHCGVMAAWSRKTLKVVEEFWRFLEKRPLTVTFSKLSSESFHCITDQRYCVQILWNVADRKSAKSCVIYWTKKFRLPLKLSLLCKSRPKPATASPQQSAHSAPDFIQIGSLLVEL